jgi:hypothetical protein
MKKVTTILTIVLLQTATLFAVNENDTLSKQKQCFYDAKTELENMLSGKIPLDYERAVFITENAYWNNEVDYSMFKSNIDFHAKNIKNLAEVNRNESAQNFKATLLETEEQKREKYQNLLYNWAIFTYFTDTTILKTTLNDKNYIFQHLPYEYSFNDPLGVLDWKNSQVFNLLDKNKANCYAMTSFFKILAERLKTDASIGIAPGHVYITHIDQKGTHYNIELANRAFPGAGSIMTLTYTPVEAVRNGIAMRTLDSKQSVALCLIYLAKGYEHKFNAKTDDFLYQCAVTTLKYDSLNLNAMLLKAEVLEEKIVKSNKTVAQLQINKEFKEYQNLIVTLFENGYREMPLDMKNLIINRLQRDSLGLILTDHTPKGFQTINPKDDRYATLSWGMFDEVHEPKLIEQYGRTLLNTKTKKITKFVTVDSLYNKYPIDPVVFAWQIDPLASKYPNMSPYAAFNNNPIYFIDDDGREGVASVKKNADNSGGTITIKAVYFVEVGPNGFSSEQYQSIMGINQTLNSQNYTITDENSQYKGYNVQFDLQIVAVTSQEKAQSFAVSEKELTDQGANAGINLLASNLPIGNSMILTEQSEFEAIPSVQETAKENNVGPSAVLGITSSDLQHINIPSKSGSTLFTILHEVFHTLYTDKDGATSGIGAGKSLPNESDINDMMKGFENNNRVVIE